MHRLRTIDINHSMTYYPSRDGENMCEFKVSFPKTNVGIRVIPMIDKVYEVLLQEYQFQCEYGFNTVQVDKMTGLIFANRFGNIYNPGAINRAIKREPITIRHFPKKWDFKQKRRIKNGRIKNYK